MGHGREVHEANRDNGEREGTEDKMVGGQGALEED